jgi:superoxide dismutase, Fe-Mn family
MRDTTPDSGITRRDVLAVAGLAASGSMLTLNAASALAGVAPAATPAVEPATGGLLTLPTLPYPTDALAPAIDEITMSIHHGKHHKAYVDNANKALAGTPLAGLMPGEILKRMGEVPADKRMAVRNNVGGHVNHSLFWELMAPVGKTGSGPSKELSTPIGKVFGSLKGLQEKFNAAATSRFGSGWAWLVVNEKGSLSIFSTPNQDNPWMGAEIAGNTGTPILAVDVWEHAYYLKYQNRRADYLAAWWTIVNWEKVNALYAAAVTPR